MIGRKGIFFAFCCFYAQIVMGQEGGPPMLTDDARVADYREWEINTSVNTSVTDILQLAIPYIDANYGLAPNLQLKAEAPYIYTIGQKHGPSEIGDIILGVKYRFLDEEKYFISAATFPQWTATGETGFYLPLLLEKTIGRFLIGEHIGYFAGDNTPNQFHSGTLLGFRASQQLHLMLEYFQQKKIAHPEKAAFLNVGFRHPLTQSITLMGSFGTQVVSHGDAPREHFISWLGIQTLF